MSLLFSRCCFRRASLHKSYWTGLQGDYWAVRMQAPPTALIFSSALLEKKRALTMTGCLGSTPLPNTCMGIIWSFMNSDGFKWKSVLDCSWYGITRTGGTLAIISAKMKILEATFSYNTHQFRLWAHKFYYVSKWWTLPWKIQLWSSQ